MGKSINNDQNGLQQKLMDESTLNSDVDESFINQSNNIKQQQKQQLDISLQDYQTLQKKSTSTEQLGEIEESKENFNSIKTQNQQISGSISSKISQSDQNNNNNNNFQSKSQTNSNLSNTPIVFNIPQSNEISTTQNEQVLISSGLGGSNDIAQREGSMIEVNALKLQNSRVSYQDLDELHEDLLDEREQNEIDEKKGVFSKMCICIRPKQKEQDNWLKHFKLIVKNSRFIKNSWSGGLFQLINSRFSDYKNNNSEQQELHKNAQITLDDQKLKRESSSQAFSSQRTTLDNRQNSNTFPTKSLSTDRAGTQQINSTGDPVVKDLKNVIQNSVILEEDVESLRDSLRNENILQQFQGSSFGGDDRHNSINNSEDMKYQKIKQNQNKQKINHQTEIKPQQNIDNENNQRINSRLEILGRSVDIVTQQTKNDSKPPKVKLESKYKNRIRSSSLKKRALMRNSISRNGSEQRNPSQLQNNNNNNNNNNNSHDSRFEDSVQLDEMEESMGISNTIKTNTLLINSEFLQEKDYELYQAVVYYKTITLVIEQHLVEENNFTQEKPLRVIRDNFIEFYVRQYGKNLQKLEEDQIIDSIQNLKEFVTLYLEIIREYYKLDELVDKCLYADRFITTDNLINFLCSILFQDDAVYSIVYVSHCHFDPKISLKYFKNVKALHQNIQLDVLKVNEEYCLNEQTLLKMQQKMAKQNCSINDSNILKGYTFKPPFQKAFEYIKTIAYQRSPVHKLKVIIKTQDLINECIKDFYDYFGIDYTDIYYDADNLVGIFSYILIKSEVYDIIAHCKIIENFATKNTLNSHSGYLLVTLQCCIRFIASINANVLLNQNKLELIKL